MQIPYQSSYGSYFSYYSYFSCFSYFSCSPSGRMETPLVATSPITSPTAAVIASTTMISAPERDTG